jgi:hypothetical protein
VEEGAARGRSVSRLNVLIAITAAIIGLIYGYDLGALGGPDEGAGRTAPAWC